MTGRLVAFPLPRAMVPCLTESPLVDPHVVADPTTTPSTARGALLAEFIPRHGLGTTVLAVRETSASIGRAVSNPVVLDDPSVSAEHAEVRLRGGIWWLEDLGSVNGSWIDGQPVHGARPLAPGSAVRLGAMEFVFAPHDRWEDSPTIEVTPESPSSRGAGRVLLAPRFVMAESAPSSSGPIRWLVVAGVVIAIAFLWFVLAGGSR